VPGSVDWSSRTICVAGLGVSGFAAADALLQLGSGVVVVDERTAAEIGGHADILGILGADLRLGAESAQVLPEGIDLVVTSPGWRPTAPLLLQAAAAGIPVWGEVELAWHVRPADRPAPWLVVTGTNGKTTTVRMLASILEAAGHRAVAAGNIGTPIVEAVLADPPYDVIAVELSSFQLHWTHSIRPLASAVLNVAPDHVDWHGSLEAYALDKGKAYQGTEVACVYNVQDPQTEALVREADVQDGCRAVGFTLGIPGVGMLGVVEDVLVDRAFEPQPRDSAAELAAVSDVKPFAPHNIANALAAAALARAFGVPARAVRDGLRAFRPDGHRIASAGRVGEVDYVDDSKATNPHAASASLAAYDSVVWIAGGLAKGAAFDDLVQRAAPRLRAVVLLGRDRAVIAEALRRHAPQIPVVEVGTTDTGVMDEVVVAAAALAQPGDTVLLAPACASMDLFNNYGERGDAFVASVGRLPGAAAR